MRTLSESSHRPSQPAGRESILCAAWLKNVILNIFPKRGSQAAISVFDLRRKKRRWLKSPLLCGGRPLRLNLYAIARHAEPAGDGAVIWPTETRCQLDQLLLITSCSQSFISAARKPAASLCPKSETRWKLLEIENAKYASVITASCAGMGKIQVQGKKSHPRRLDESKLDCVTLIRFESVS